MKRFVKLLYQWWRIALFDPRKILRFPSELLRFYSDYQNFQRLSDSNEKKVKLEFHPVFFQRGIRSSFDAHYVYQSAWALKRILSHLPKEHIDISSNIPFVAALSASVPVKFCEYRPPLIRLPNLSTQHADILSLPFADRSVKSLSCLHVLEHIGLGRYGDPVNPSGFALACKEIARVIAPGGFAFLSIPVGKERTCFNMHRISAPNKLLAILGQEFRLREFCLVTDSGEYLENVATESAATQKYACGLYWFEKVNNG